MMVLTFIILSTALNYSSLSFAKAICIDNNKIPAVEKSLLAFNWSVSCK
ncbi:hypothetical protein ACQ0QQ_00275 [Lysinibacillus sphaericus]